MIAIILAGGKGTRLQSRVSDRPKPLAPVQGFPFLSHQMSYWKKQGVQKFILSIGYMAETMIAQYGREFLGIPVEYSVEKTPLGTGGGLLHALTKVQPHLPFLVLNGDSFSEISLETLIKTLRAHPSAEGVFSLHSVAEGSRYSSVEWHDGRVVGFKTRGSVLGEAWINAGVYLFKSKQIFEAMSHDLQNQSVSLEDEIFKNLFEKSTFFLGMPLEGRFIDIGVPEDYDRAQTLDLFSTSPVEC